MSDDHTSPPLTQEFADKFVSQMMDSWTRNDADGLFAFLADDVEYFDDGMPGPVHSKAAARAYFDKVSIAVTDFEAVLREGPFLHPSKPMIMINWQYGGNHTGDWDELKATGKHFSLEGASIYVFRGEEVIRWRAIWNVTEMVRQLTAAG